MLRRWLKEVNQRGPKKGGNKNLKVNSAIQLLVQKLEANAKWIEEKRAKVEFAPNNRKGVEGFLEELSWEKTPLGAYVVGQRKTREEKARIVEESRQEEERRRRQGGDGGPAHGQLRGQLAHGPGAVGELVEDRLAGRVPEGGQHRLCVRHG